MGAVQTLPGMLLSGVEIRHEVRALVPGAQRRIVEFYAPAEVPHELHVSDPHTVVQAGGRERGVPPPPHQLRNLEVREVYGGPHRPTPATWGQKTQKNMSFYHLSLIYFQIHLNILYLNRSSLIVF